MILAALLASATLLTLSGNPSPLIISKATAGKEPETAKDRSTTYTLAVPEGETAHIFASLDAPLPQQTFLQVAFSSPYHSKEALGLLLDCIPKNIMTGIRPGTYRNLPILYEYRATVQAGPIPLMTRKLILTVTSDKI